MHIRGAGLVDASTDPLKDPGMESAQSPASPLRDPRLAEEFKRPAKTDESQAMTDEQGREILRRRQLSFFPALASSGVCILRWLFEERVSRT